MLTPATLTTAGNGTLTAAQLLSGLVTRSGPTAAFTDTTDTAAALIAALGAGVPANAGEPVQVANTTAYPLTLAGGTNVTVTGGSVIPANSTAWLTITPTSPTAVTISFAASVYNNFSGYDPSTILTQFGSGTGTFGEEGNVYKFVSGAGASPGATGADNVIAVYSLPANSLDGVGNRELTIQAIGSFANNTNTKRVKIIFNPSTAVVGSTVGAGGTTLVDTGTYNTTGAVGWNLSANVVKYGAANSNTQLGTTNGVFIGGTHSGAGAGASVPQAITAIENAAILVAVTGNAGTTAGDILVNMFTINAMN